MIARVDGFPTASRYVLRRARLPASVLDGPIKRSADAEGFVHADLLVSDRKIAAISPALAIDAPGFDMDGGQLWPACVEVHTHLDKGHTFPRARNPDGTILGAVEAVRLDRTANWSPEDVDQRFDFSLRCAYVHGTAAIRTHIDSYHPQAPISWPVFTRLRERWRDRIELQGVALTMLNVYETDEGRDLADLVARSGGILGSVTRIAGPPADQTSNRIAACLDQLFRLAAERGLDVDLHTDETADLVPDTLREVALAVLRNEFKGRVVCGHCCSLSLRSDEAAGATIALVKQAGICVVTLPMVNLYLQGRRRSRTPGWRGVTLVRELCAAGVVVAASSDNSRDPMHAFGDFDPVEVYRESVRICQLDLDTEWVGLVTRAPADIMRLPERGRLALGASADLIAFRARSMSELLSRPQHDRIVVRHGKPVCEALPDYRELDAALFPR